MVGEIRDRTVAEGVFGAALTGHLVLTTFHAGSAALALSRLSEMDIEPYLLRSGLLAVLNQRLLRRLCDCARTSDDPNDALGLPVHRAKLPVGCPQCLSTGYRGRVVLVELLPIAGRDLNQILRAGNDASAIEREALQAGMISRWQRACSAVEAGWTSAAEVRRVLGLSTVEW